MTITVGFSFHRGPMDSKREWYDFLLLKNEKWYNKLRKLKLTSSAAFSLKSVEEMMVQIKFYPSKRKFVSKSIVLVKESCQTDKNKSSNRWKIPLKRFYCHSRKATEMTFIFLGITSQFHYNHENISIPFLQAVSFRY